MKTKYPIAIALVLIAGMLSSNLFAQNTIKDIPELDASEIEKAVHYFNINNGSLQGDGADVLKQYIATSKFFVLGEYHYSTEISKLTESMVPLMDQSGYKVAVFEVGPHSAEKLRELSTVPDETESRLKEFNAKNYVKLTPTIEMLPIPFFNTVYDAAFLEGFAKAEMDIWGIDQEFFSSVLFLGEEMVKSKSNDSNYQDFEKAWNIAKEVIKKEFDNFQGPEKFLKTIMKHPDIEKFKNMFNSDDYYAQSVFQQLEKSWDIYLNSRTSHGDRVDLIRSNFLTNYESYDKKHKDARYFIKIGAWHAGKTNTSVGLSDVGALTQEIAKIENTKSTTVAVEKAFYNGKDYRDTFPAFRNFAKKDQWTIIELKKLREGLMANKFQIMAHPDYQELKENIMGYDLALIPPSDEKPSNNM